MFYSLVKPLLFALDPEQAHDISLEMLQQFHRLIPNRRIDKPTRVMGLDFPNPVGLAAGLDKNADYLDGLGRLGFGFIEVGSVTPKPQPGNSQPRVFRLAKYQSLINRMVSTTWSSASPLHSATLCLESISAKTSVPRWTRPCPTIAWDSNGSI
jgi:dihydroorotate dehydrogenase